MNNEIAVIRIKLKDAPFPIWRRIHLNPDIPLSDFHEIIQIVMGWQNCHLYGFRVKDKFYSDDRADLEMLNALSSSSTTLKEIIKSNKKFIYEYDFGDGWIHEIVFNKYIEPKKGVEYPICSSGKGMCPPEDIGGMWGYEELLYKATLPNPSEEFLEEIEYLDLTIEELKDIKNKALDIEFINQLLKHYLDN
ncbi:plasmid pRiA4b ORF-3 family protein [Methanobrevibacter filiformis]|uniref:Plasmid pRiA4b ORF-3-like protein n=1 Tax=Methanobrevibacter filiformis TaxID=55758 RepID=A0A166FID0_9EURY|nr:plasmid pRiA4b ORF-3 family protein [Methanobrevibacter filiformis]KZX17703.1 plasmid pRiA4b ORF-3-like protein [Methanobrevibacter filiformis]